MIRPHTGVENPWFSVFIVYGRHESGLRAFRVFQSLVREFGRDFQFSQAMFKLADLADRPTSRQAAHDLSQTDMIIVSVADESELTDEFRDWAETWPVAAQPDERLLAVMLNGDAPNRNGEPSFLRRLAASKNMGFISTGDAVPPAADHGRMGLVRSLINPPRRNHHYAPAPPAFRPTVI